MDRVVLLEKEMDIMDDITQCYNLQMTVSPAITLSAPILMIFLQLGLAPDHATIDAILVIDTVGVSVQRNLAKAELSNPMRPIATTGSVFRLAQITQCLYLCLAQFLLHILHFFV